MATHTNGPETRWAETKLAALAKQKAKLTEQTLVQESRVVLIKVRDLRIHPKAQRKLQPTTLKKIEKNFRWGSIRVLDAVECEVDGVFGIWIVDGQHRVEVLRKLGFDDWLVQVNIHSYIKDDAQAADLFIDANNGGQVPPYAKFTNAQLAGHADAVGITKIATDRRLRISNNMGDGVLCCVTALNTVYNYDDGVTLAATLDTVVGAWGRSAAGLEGRLIEGLGLVYRDYGSKIDRESLIKKLAKYEGGPSALIGNARGLRKLRHTASTAHCIAELVIAVYNSKRRSGRLEPE